MAAQAVLSPRGRGEPNRKQEGTALGTGCQVDELRSSDSYPLGDREIFPACTVEATQVQPCRGGGHHDLSQCLNLLIGNLDQPACRVGADPTQLPPIASVQETIGQAGGDPRNCGHIIDAERATRHQIPQLRSERPSVNPLIANSLALGEHSHTDVPSSKPLYVEGFAKGPDVNADRKLL